MPSIFESIKRLMSGQPVFQDSDRLEQESGQHKQQDQAAGERGAQTETDQGQKPQTATPRDQQGRKIMPVAFVKDLKCYEKGEHDIECWAAIANESEQDIELDKLHFLGRKVELDMPLKPDQERAFMVYRGPRPKDMNQRVAELRYFDRDHDYFAAIHDVPFEWQPDKTYLIGDLKLRLPIRDIEG